MGKRVIAAVLLLFCIGIPQTVAAEGTPSLSSLSAVLYEPTSGRFLYEKDADARRPQLARHPFTDREHIFLGVVVLF